MYLLKVRRSGAGSFVIYIYIMLKHIIALKRPLVMIYAPAWGWLHASERCFAILAVDGSDGLSFFTRKRVKAIWMLVIRLFQMDWN